MFGHASHHHQLSSVPITCSRAPSHILEPHNPSPPFFSHFQPQQDINSRLKHLSTLLRHLNASTNTCMCFETHWPPLKLPPVFTACNHFRWYLLPTSDRSSLTVNHLQALIHISKCGNPFGICEPFCTFYYGPTPCFRHIFINIPYHFNCCNP